MPYPTGTDVAAVLLEAGIVAPGSVDLSALAVVAARKFGTMTGYRPFIAVSDTETYDPPGSKSSYGFGGGGTVLTLRRGLVALTSLSVSGTLKVQGSDFYLTRASHDGPYEQIKFVLPVYGAPQSVSIVGTWGYCASLSSDKTSDDYSAFRAIALIAASDYCLDVAQQALSQGLREVASNDQHVSFGIETLTQAGANFMAQAQPIAKSYERMAAYV